MNRTESLFVPHAYPPAAQRLCRGINRNVNSWLALRGVCVSFRIHMPGPKKSRVAQKRVSAPVRSQSKSRDFTLVVIDHVPLQRAAWAEFHTARKRHEKAARDLHRHEQVDVPAYEGWLHRTFPVMITTLRELHAEVFEKSRQVEAVQAMAALSGRSPKKIWREQKAADANPDPFEKLFEDDFFGEDPKRSRTDADDFEHDGGFGGSGNHFRREFERAPLPRETAFTREAKAIYRRLVQHLHPDRGGDFNAVRKRLWHEVQQAWEARDADWLGRIEVEWETANEILGPTSPLSRLRRAIEELHAARRDIERKLREYRGSFPWRFSLSEKKRAELHRRTEASFQHDLDFLRRQLAYLKATIAAWESDRSNRSRERFSTWRSGG
ncbi:MAG TPA: J domain-containing protein [Opitutus sp.]|nr:J domain-containing protein [Opitutus sp.]